MPEEKEKLKIFVTGTAGFIGFHLARLLLNEGHTILGLDGMTDYYDVGLKVRRNQILSQSLNYHFLEARIEDREEVLRAVRDFEPTIIVHLAAQAGVRYSVENPRAYVDTNLLGTFNVMEAAREVGVAHLLMASTSSVYGANREMPFDELQRTDTPLTFYAATKKATEAMAHSWAHIEGLPITMFRFFTVYGPWGRPDMALFKFTRGILEGTPIDIYNHGNMYRDFTFVEDLVRGIALLVGTVPPTVNEREGTPVKGDSLSPVAPFRVVNIGNSEKVRLLDFVDAIEEELGKKAIRNYLDIQVGDVPATWANADLLKTLTGYRPNTDFRDGVRIFVDWYCDYHNVRRH